MNKQEIRRNMIAEKQKLSEEQIESASSAIAKQSIIKGFAGYEAVYLYQAFNQEVRTVQILEYLWENRIPAAVPKIVDDKMAFYIVTRKTKWSSGKYGILEPVSEEMADFNQVLMLLPGLAFDSFGGRVGYGRGYYDIYIKNHREAIKTKTALAYDFQIIHNIEIESFDERVDQIVTPTTIIYCKLED